LAGANVIYGLGMLEMGISFDLAQLVLDNEVAGMILHVVNGIPVNDETLSVDAIREVGIFQDYLAHDSTYKHRMSQTQPMFMDRRMRPDWEAAGKDIYQKALGHARQVLETHKVPELPKNVRSEIRSIIEEAEKERGVYKGKEERKPVNQRRKRAAS
jgi:trimethylamine--corrinoid protein Co-methyltransferase